MIPTKTKPLNIKEHKRPFQPDTHPIILQVLWQVSIQWRLSILLQMLWQLLRIYGCYPCPCNRLGMAEYSYIRNDTNHIPL